MEILKKRVMAAAKINLFLDVTGRCDNGYHTINSIMHLPTVVKYTVARGVSAIGWSATTKRRLLL